VDAAALLGHTPEIYMRTSDLLSWALARLPVLLELPWRVGPEMILKQCPLNTLCRNDRTCL
jgi:hypothetical protein